MYQHKTQVGIVLWWSCG